jgi:biopolymer transport protein ExbD
MPQAKARTVVGIGITTLVTIMVVVLLTTFSVLALVSAHSDLRLSLLTNTAMEHYYAADARGQRWLAELDTFVGTTETGDRAAILMEAGYSVATGDDGTLVVSEHFVVDMNRQISVTVEIDAQGTLTVTRWQSGLLQADELP